MIKKLFSILTTAVFLLPFTKVESAIVETMDIETVRSYAHKNSLVLFNITSTLYESSMTLADQKFREYFSARAKQVIADPVLSQALINKMKNEVVTKIPKKLVEEKAPGLIAELQEKHIPVFAITEKQLSTEYAGNFGWITSQHLLSLGIDFENTLSYFNLRQGGSDKFTLAFGLLFTNKKPVGEAITSFLEVNEFYPSEIIMIDNSSSALKSVETAFEGTDCVFKGFRYGRSDQKKADFNPILGIIQLNIFVNENRLMPDEEAKQFYASHPEMDYIALLDQLILKLAEGGF